jgi:hypothetical protein
MCRGSRRLRYGRSAGGFTLGRCQWRLSVPKAREGPLAACAPRRDAVVFVCVKFELISHIRAVETIASGQGIHILARLVRLYGRANWRKLKGLATVRLEDGTIAEAEVHWFEAHGIGKRKMKIKRLID